MYWPKSAPDGLYGSLITALSTESQPARAAARNTLSLYVCILLGRYSPHWSSSVGVEQGPAAQVPPTPAVAQRPLLLVLVERHPVVDDVLGATQAHLHIRGGK